MNDFRLDKKIVFILGGSGLIGKSVSKQFVKAVATVIILDNDKKNSLLILKEIQKINSKSDYFYFGYWIWNFRL